MDCLDYVDVSENGSSDEDDEFLHVVFDIIFPHWLKIFHHRPNLVMKYRKDEIKSPTERYSTFFVHRSTSSVGLKINNLDF